MTPLQQIAMGLVLVVLDTGTAYDALPDPLGWALALPAVRRLPAEVRVPPLVAGAVAGVLSAVFWVPAGREIVAGEDASLDWLLLLAPDLVFGTLLCWALGRTARAALAGPPASRADGRARATARSTGKVEGQVEGQLAGKGARANGVWPTLAFLFGVAALGPVPFLAAEATIPGDLAALAQLCWIALIGLLFWWHNASWAPVRRTPGSRAA